MSEVPLKKSERPGQEPGKDSWVYRQIFLGFGSVLLVFLVPVGVAFFMIRPLNVAAKSRPKIVEVREGRKEQGILQILRLDPATLSAAQFYECERAILAEGLRPDGFFLGEDEVLWMKKALAAFEARGIPLREHAVPRGVIFADSYFHLKDYEKARAEYRESGNDAEAEKMEWYLANEEVRDGPLQLQTHPGDIRFSGIETARAEDERYLFTAYFKGPVYRYDKVRQEHAVIWYPADASDWSDSLEWNGENLLIGMGKNRRLMFSNRTRNLGPFSASRTAVPSSRAPEAGNETAKDTVLPAGPAKEETLSKEAEGKDATDGSDRASQENAGEGVSGQETNAAPARPRESAGAGADDMLETSGVPGTDYKVLPYQETREEAGTVSDEGPQEPSTEKTFTGTGNTALPSPEKKNASGNLLAAYPEITSKKLSSKECEAVNAEIKKFFRDLLPGKGVDPGAAGRGQIDFKVLCLTPDFISIQFDHTEFEIGSASGFARVRGFNYDVKKQKVLKLKDLFREKSGYLEQLTDHVMRDLERRRQGKALPKPSIDPNSQAFGLTQKNLVLYLGEKTAPSPAFAGSYLQVLIPYQDLVFLTKDMIRRLSVQQEAVLARVDSSRSPNGRA